MIPGDWAWSAEHGQPCRVLEAQPLWGERFCQVWLPNLGRVARVPAASLGPLDGRGPESISSVAWVAAAARVADTMGQGLLLAPLRASVIPLPHQIRALSRALSGDGVRYLLADEVGLGKTIEAGLILRELKLRGRVRRCLIVVPKGLAAQWVAEMRTHFGEEFRLMVPSDFAAYRRLVGDRNLWRQFDQVVCPMDSVKPLERRRGWSEEQVAEYNRDRFEDLISAGWDLVIVDEAHRLGGSTDQVARYKLGEGLSGAAPYLLLLSATPHQGKSDGFFRLVSLLDDRAFPDPSSVTRERIRPYLIRTEKRAAIDPQGRPLFMPRQTRLLPVRWEQHHRGQRTLYQAVTDYVREGYNQAVREKKSYVGFLMLLMQRLVTSSTRAIRVTLERRLEALRLPVEQLSLFPVLAEDDWVEMDGQEQLETLLGARLKALKNERSEVELLLEAARHTEVAGPDAKAEALLEMVYRLQREEGDPGLKLLVFTEFVPTQGMLREFLEGRGFSVACLNGSMELEERQRAQDAFAGDAQFLVSTDAGGEGLNLQFCHVVVNYDIPWNPMRLEQRIGRVDRIGQGHPVRAVNFILQDSVEYRVMEVLEEKLAVILREFGADKVSDVLDSAQAGQLFEELQVDALLRPDDLNTRIDSVLYQLREQARAVRESASVFSTEEGLDPGEARSLMDHPVSHWIERMVVSYLDARGGKAEVSGREWRLTWPGTGRVERAVFAAGDLATAPAARLLTLDDPRVGRVVEEMAAFVPGQAVPLVVLADLPREVRGVWSLWRIGAASPGGGPEGDGGGGARREGAGAALRQFMPLFLHDDGRLLLPTARHVWDQLVTGAGQVMGQLEARHASDLYATVRELAEGQGRFVYDGLVRSRAERLAREREKAEYAFAARRRAIGRNGLAAVRYHRLAELDREEREWQWELSSGGDVMPELTPLLLVRVEGEG